MYVPILRDDISDSEFISTCTRHLTCYVTQIPNTYVFPKNFAIFFSFSDWCPYFEGYDLLLSNYVYDWFYMCSKLFLIGKWYISICLSIIAFKPYVIGFPIIMQYCNAIILEVCFERKIIQISQKLLNM